MKPMFILPLQAHVCDCMRILKHDAEGIIFRLLENKMLYGDLAVSVSS